MIRDSNTQHRVSDPMAARRRTLDRLRAKLRPAHFPAGWRPDSPADDIAELTILREVARHHCNCRRLIDTIDYEIVLAFEQEFASRARIPGFVKVVSSADELARLWSSELYIAKNQQGGHRLHQRAAA